MTSAKKSVFKRIVVIIIAVLIFFSAISMVATKIVYDNIFERYDTKIEIPATLSDIVNGREKKEYYSGQNMLTGYLYRADINNSQNGLIIMAPGFHAGTDNYLWQIKSLLDYGWSVFVFDTTGSCESEGESSVGFAQIPKYLIALTAFWMLSKLSKKRNIIINSTIQMYLWVVVQ